MIGEGIDGIDLFDPAVLFELFPETDFPLFSVPADKREIHNTDGKMCCIRIKRGSCGNPSRLNVVRSDTGTDTGGIDVAVDHDDFDAGLCGSINCRGVFRITDGGKNNGIGMILNGFFDVSVLPEIVLFRLRAADGKFHVVFRPGGVCPGENGTPEFGGSGFGDQINPVWRGTLLRLSAGAEQKRYQKEQEKKLIFSHSLPPLSPWACGSGRWYRNPAHCQSGYRMRDRNRSSACRSRF